MPITTTSRFEGVTAHDVAAPRRAAFAAAAAAVGALCLAPWVTAGAQAFLGCAAVVMALTAWHRGRARADAGREGSLEVTPEGLAFESAGRREVLPWGGVRRWSVDGSRDLVTLTRADGSRRSLALPGDAVGVVVEALRRAHARRALTVTLRGRSGAGSWAAAVTLLTLGAPLPLADAVARIAGGAAGVLTWALGVALVARVAREVSRSRVTVGDDGIQLQQLGCERFVPWAYVTDLDWDERGVRVTLIDGEEIALPVLSAAMVRAEGDASVARAIGERDALHERLRAGLERWSERRVERDAMEAMLDRQGRPLDAWRAAVRGLAARLEGYRGVRLDPLVAARVLDDPCAPLDRRVAAVWALRDQDVVAVTRVRAAVDAVACEPVREALARAADDYLDEDTLDRAEAVVDR